jgi:hypothetical protein
MIVLALAILFSCTSVQKQKAEPGKPDDLHFHNLQVLRTQAGRDRSRRCTAGALDGGHRQAARAHWTAGKPR